MFAFPVLRETSQCDMCCIVVILGKTGVIEDFAASNHRGRAQQARNGIGQRRFATATFARQAKDLAASQSETHIGYGMYSAVRCQVIDRSEERRVGKECRSRWSTY